MNKSKFIEKIFHKKTIIKSIFIFPLISCIVMCLAIKDFANLNHHLAYFGNLRHLFVGILILLFLNLIANFCSLMLYYCLSSRVETLSKKYHKKI